MLIKNISRVRTRTDESERKVFRRMFLSAYLKSLMGGDASIGYNILKIVVQRKVFASDF